MFLPYMFEINGRHLYISLILNLSFHDKIMKKDKVSRLYISEYYLVINAISEHNSYTQSFAYYFQITFIATKHLIFIITSQEYLW